MVFVFAGSDEARMLVEGKGDVGLVGETGAFEDDFGDEFGHGGILAYSPWL